jgi:hypothetical protein
MGITCLFALQVCSASLSGFFFGRLYGLPEAWITPAHEQVLIYSGWMCIAIIAAMWLAWWPRAPKKDEKKQRLRREAFAWMTPGFVFLALALGAASSLAVPFLFGIPTIGTAVSLLAGWLKLGLIGAVILCKKRGYLRPLLIATVIYIPLALIWALRSGHTPLSLDAIVPIALVSTCLTGVNFRSFAKLFIWMVPCVYLMFGWMASRSVIRSGELEQFSLQERASRFMDVFFDNLLDLRVTRYDVQYLLFDRIDMSDILAQETAFESSPEGEDEFAYGGTLIDGAIAVVPRAIWEDKPTVAGYATFVGKFTGISREDDTSIGVPVQFELYANGGSSWVIVGIFILFYLCARLEQFVAFCDKPLHTLMPSLMFLMSFASGIEQIMLVFSTALAGAATVFVIALAIEVFFPKLLPQFQLAKIRRRLEGPVVAAG